MAESDHQPHNSAMEPTAAPSRSTVSRAGGVALAAAHRQSRYTYARDSLTL